MDAEVLMIVELDGTKSEVEELFKQIKQIAEKNKSNSFKLSKNEKERLGFWSGNFLRILISFLSSFAIV